MLDKCHILFSRKNKKIIISLSSAEFAQSMVSDNLRWYFFLLFLHGNINNYLVGINWNLLCKAISLNTYMRYFGAKKNKKKIWNRHSFNAKHLG